MGMYRLHSAKLYAYFHTRSIEVCIISRTRFAHLSELPPTPPRAAARFRKISSGRSRLTELLYPLSIVLRYLVHRQSSPRPHILTERERLRAARPAS